MFNLSKHSQTLDGALDGLGQATDSAIDTVNPSEQSELGVEQMTQGLTEEEKAAVVDSAIVNKWNKIVAQLGNLPPEVFNAIQKEFRLNPELAAKAMKGEMSDSIDQDMFKATIAGFYLWLIHTEKQIGLGQYDSTEIH